MKKAEAIMKAKIAIKVTNDLTSFLKEETYELVPVTLVAILPI
jgi:hypothetical protein